jgi:sulfatase maturation enzyme AslB (radical SAM superfamily)
MIPKEIALRLFDRLLLEDKTRLTARANTYPKVQNNNLELTIKFFKTLEGFNVAFYIRVEHLKSDEMSENEITKEEYIQLQKKFDKEFIKRSIVEAKESKHLVNLIRKALK